MPYYLQAAGWGGGAGFAVGLVPQILSPFVAGEIMADNGTDTLYTSSLITIFQTRTVLSPLPDATWVPSGLKATE